MFTQLWILAYLTIFSSYTELLTTVNAQGFNFPDSSDPVPADRSGNALDRNHENGFDIVAIMIYLPVTHSSKTGHNNFTWISNFDNTADSDRTNKHNKYKHCDIWSNVHLCSNRIVHARNGSSRWIDRYSHCN